jgi:hypothetical protein
MAKRYQAHRRGRPPHVSNGASRRYIREHGLITDTHHHLQPRFISSDRSLRNARDGDCAFGSRTTRRGGVSGCCRIGSGEIGAHLITCWPSTISSSSARVRSSFMAFAWFVFAKDRRYNLSRRFHLLGASVTTAPTAAQATLST